MILYTRIIGYDMYFAQSNFCTEIKITNSLWIRCPSCNGKTRTKVYKDTVLINFPLYCPKCKQEFRVNVVQLKMLRSEEPKE